MGKNTENSRIFPWQLLMYVRMHLMNDAIYNKTQNYEI